MSASPFLTGNYAPVSDELAVEGLPVLGTLRPRLRGTLYRNGANPHFPPVAPHHWFTGDGMVHAITTMDGQAAYRNLWPQTPRFLAEAEAGRLLIAGFGQRLPGTPDELDTGVANTHVVPHAGRLLALEEAHLPMLLRAGDLSTIGYEDFGGVLSGRFTGPPKSDPATGQLVFFSYPATGPFSTGIMRGTIEADGRVSRLEPFEAPYCSMMHDFAVTAAHVVLSTAFEFWSSRVTRAAARCSAGGWAHRRYTPPVLRADLVQAFAAFDPAGLDRRAGPTRP